jgi:hypothetical protein
VQKVELDISTVKLSAFCASELINGIHSFSFAFEVSNTNLVIGTTVNHSR